MKKVVCVILLLGIFLMGCETEKPIGGERDEHSCLGPAGYTWDGGIGACIRNWELNEEQRKAAKIAVAPLSYDVTIIGVDFANCVEEGCFAVHMQRNDNQEVSIVIISKWKIIETKEAPKERAQIIVEGYIRNSKEFIENNGRDLKIWEIRALECDGCYEIKAEYKIDSVKEKTDIVTVELVMEGWQIADTVKKYTKLMSSAECEEEGGRIVNIVKEGPCNEDEEDIGKVNKSTSPNICCVSKSELTYSKVLEIAEQSECTEKGSLTDSYFYNENSKTWWIELEMKPEFENKICNPACVVSEETKTAEINWRCTGLIPEE